MARPKSSQQNEWQNDWTRGEGQQGQPARSPQTPTPTQAPVGPQPVPLGGSPTPTGPSGGTFGNPTSSPGGDIGSPVTTPPASSPGGDMGTPGGVGPAPASGLSGTPAAPSAATTEAGASAKATISDFLGAYGLGGLADWAWGQYLNGTPLSQLMLDLRSRPEYQARFPAMQELAKQGHAISEAQYVNYEQSAIGIMRAAGLPEGFYDQPDDFTKLLVGNVALPELKSRVDAYQTAAFSSPPEVLAALKDTYGISAGDLTAFFIDPDKALPLIQKQWAASQASGFSQVAGFGKLSQNQAEQVGDLNLSPLQLQSQFGALAGLGNVLENMPGQQQGVSREQALGAAFSGNAGDLSAIDTRRRQLANQFGGGGGVAATQQGVSGAGVAR